MRPYQKVKKLVNGQELQFQLIVIVLTLLADAAPMERRLRGINNHVEKIRSITEVVNRTLESLQTAAEAPRHIRNLLE